jgi:hypothetical protein
MVVPCAIVIGPVPTAASAIFTAPAVTAVFAAPIIKVPSFTLMPPEKVLGAARINDPSPVFVRAPPVVVIRDCKMRPVGEEPETEMTGAELAKESRDRL